MAPTVEPGDDQSIDEGGSFSSSGSFSDPGEDTATATVDYGDGEGEQPLTLNPDNTFSLGHTYTDDDTFTVVVTVTDDDQGVGTGELTVTVGNLAPEVVAGAGQSAFVDDTLTIAATFTDAGTSDTHTATIDWNDGTIEPGIVTEADGSGTVDGSHEYTDPGTFLVTVSVTDDDGAVGTGSLQVIVLVAFELIEGLEVGSFTVTPESPVPPETVAVSFTIANTNEEGTITLPTLELLVNGEVETTFPGFELAAGEVSDLLNHTITRREPGTYAVQILDQARTFTIEPPKLTIINLSVTPRLAGPGDTAVISSDVRNDGGTVGRFTVDIRVDGSSDVHQIRLPTGASDTLVRFVTIPGQPPAAGIASPGVHSVAVGRLSSSYEVARPAIETPIPTAPPFNPFTTRATDPSGNPLDVDPDGEFRFGGGSITVSVPVLAPAGVGVDRFVDTTSGISIIGRDVEVPVKDPDTGEVLLRLQGALVGEGLVGAGNAATGTFEFLNMFTEERRTDLSADDPAVGRLGVSLRAGLEELPEGVSLELTIKKELTDEQRTKVELLAREGGKIVANEAGTVTVTTENLDPQTGISDATVTMKVSANWVETYGVENVRIAHVDHDGEVENLVPVCTGPDDNNEYTCVANTDRGLSEFSLLALVDVPAAFFARNLVIDPPAVEPGQTVKVSIDIVNEGVQPGSFSAILKVKRPGTTEFEPVAVKELNLEGESQGTITFFVLREEQGDYEVEIEGRKDEFSRGSFGVFRKIDPARLTFIDLFIFPEEVRPGEPVLVTMSVVNEGLDAGRTEVEFRDKPGPRGDSVPVGPRTGEDRGGLRVRSSR